MRASLLISSLGCWLVVAAVARAQPSQTDEEMAKALFRAGQIAFDSGGYAEALQRFREAYERSARPQLLYNLGIAADRLRRDDEALAYFRQYLAELPDAENRVEVESRIRALEEAQARPPVPAPTNPAPAPAVAPRPAEPASAAPDPPPSVSPYASAEPVATAVDADRPTDEGHDDLMSKWWFWAAVGAVVVGGVVTSVALAGGSDETAPPVAPNSGVVVMALEAE